MMTAEVPVPTTTGESNRNAAVRLGPAVAGVLDRGASWARDLPRWRRLLVVGALLAAAWTGVVLAGGTRTPALHLFSLVLIAAVGLLGVRGALVVAVVATLLTGPLLPDDTQPTGTWLLRGAMFVAVTLLVGASFRMREAVQRDRTEIELVRALDLQPAPEPGAVDEKALTPRVPAVLRDRAFDLVFQPVYCLRDGRLLAVEALTRVRDGGGHPPDAWFRAAHTAGLGVALELAVVREALEQARDLPVDVEVAVNVSAPTLATPELVRLLADHGGPVVLELTEHDVIGSYALLRRCLQPLREGPVRIAVDDAGAGVSSLRHIVQLAPDLIKLDGSLTRGIAGSHVLQTLGRSFVDFAEGTGTVLVVEGIEDGDDLLTWASLGAMAAQGYLLGRPGPLDVDAPVPEPVRTLQRRLAA